MFKIFYYTFCGFLCPDLWRKKVVIVEEEAGAENEDEEQELEGLEGDEPPGKPEEA